MDDTGREDDIFLEKSTFQTNNTVDRNSLDPPPGIADSYTQSTHYSEIKVSHNSPDDSYIPQHSRDFRSQRHTHGLALNENKTSNLTSLGRGPTISRNNKETPLPGESVDNHSTYFGDRYQVVSRIGGEPFNSANYKDKTMRNMRRDGVNQLAPQDHSVRRTIYSPINFWLEDPSALFQTLDVVPNQDMTDAERLNAMTRVVILITAVMFIVKFPLWWAFLAIGIVVSIILWYIVKDRHESHVRHVQRQTEYLRRPKSHKSIIQPYKPTIQTPPSDTRHQYQSELLHTVQNQPLKLISIP